MLNIDHSPPNSSPPQAEGGITKQAIAPIDTNTGGDITAVGTLRFGRGAVADLGQDLKDTMENSLISPHADPSDLKAVALDYLRRGLPIIPLCSPDPDHPGDPSDPEDKGLCREHAARGRKCDGPGKRPLERWKLYQSTMPTEIEVRSWWTKYPQANIGLVTGQISNVFAVDADSDAALAHIMDHGADVEDAPMHLTGRGAHLVFAHPADAEDVEEIAKNSAGKLGKGIDVRSQGGISSWRRRSIGRANATGGTAISLISRTSRRCPAGYWRGSERAVRSTTVKAAHAGSSRANRSTNRGS